MKKLISITAIAGMLAGVVCYAAQSTDVSNRQVRDPVQLEAYLEANAADAETRISVIEAGMVTNADLLVTVGALSTTGAVTIAEGALADSKIVSADIKDGVIVNADIATGAAIASTKIGAGTWATVVITNALVGYTNYTFVVGGLIASNVNVGTAP